MIWELEGDVENQSALGGADTGPTGRREKILAVVTRGSGPVRTLRTGFG